MNTIVLGTSFNPWHNLALEELLFDREPVGMIFYLWQNQNTVVIGRHQNPWKELQVSLLEQEGGRLARRPSGGGAVYHDLGNLNFTFITGKETYDVTRQLSVILRAVRSFGVDAEFTGRNDLVLTPGSEKFSGNAYRFSRSTGMHHGTILVNADMNKLSRYLAPSKEKLVSKGVESVRARVKNISEVNPAISIPLMKDALVTAFHQEYGVAEVLSDQVFEGPELKVLEDKYSSWDWRFGKSPNFDLTLENRFAWGEIAIHLALRDGLVKEAVVYSDSLDEAFISSISPALTGSPFNALSMAQRIHSLNHPFSDELAQWIIEKDF